MSSTTARSSRNDKKRTNEAILENDAQFVQGLKTFSGESDSVSGKAGGNAQNSPAQPAGNYLAREGDSMIGPLALGPPVNFRIDIDANNTINISPTAENAQYSSNVQLEDVPTSDVLDIIAGGAFDGQLLILRTFAPPVGGITISQMTLANGGNILTPDDADFVMGDLQMIGLVFDESLLNIAGNSGTWRVLPGFGGAAGSPEVLDNLNEKDFGDQSLQLISIDWQEANFQRYRATGDNQIQFTNEPVAGKWEPMIIQITQDGGGGHSQNWNDAPFANGTPIVDTNPNAVSVFRFYNYFDGVNNVIYWSFWDTQSNQTPWLSNIDANKFILFNLAEVAFTNTVPNGPLAGNTSIFWSNGTNNMVHQIRPGNEFQILAGDFDSAANRVATFSKTLIDFTYQTLPYTLLEVGDMIVNGISQYNDRMTLKTSNVTFPQPNFSPSVVVTGANDGGDLGTNTRYWNNLNVKQIRLRDADVIIDINSIAYDSFFGGTVYNVKNSDSHLFKQFDGISSTDTLFEIKEDYIDAWTHIIRNVVDPVQPQDAATKAYVDSFVGGTWKIPVRAKADGFTFLFPNIQQVIDGVTLAVDDRVLLTDELVAKNNGIWRVAGPFAGIPLQAPLIRPDDFNSDSDMLSEVFVAVEEGDLNRNSVWHLTTPNPIIDNVTSQTWEDFNRGTTKDVIIGTLDVANDWREDVDHQIIGNNNGQEPNTGLPTSEPVGTNWTDTHTLTASDFPTGVFGIKFNRFGVGATIQCQNNDGVNTGQVRMKAFVNGTQIGTENPGVTIQPSGGYGMALITDETQAVDIQPGDVIQIKVWISIGPSVNIDLEKFAVYTFPTTIEATADTYCMALPDDGSNRVVGTEPAGITIAELLDGPPTDEQWYVESFGLDIEDSSFFGFTTIRLCFGERMNLFEEESSRTNSSTINRLIVPGTQWLAYERVTKSRVTPRP